MDTPLVTLCSSCVLRETRCAHKYACAVKSSQARRRSGLALTLKMMLLDMITDSRTCDMQDYAMELSAHSTIATLLSACIGRSKQ